MFRESDEEEKEDVSLKRKKKEEKIKISLMFEMMLSKISIIIFGRRNDILRLIILNFSFLR
jgi:hypothetical protein